MDATLWTGTLTFELVDAASLHAWRLGVVLRRELAMLWRGQRNLAMIDRDQLRTWSGTAHRPLEQHDVILTTVDGWIAVIVTDGPPAWLRPDDATRLRAVL